MAGLSHIIRLNPKLYKELMSIVTAKVFYQALKDSDERTQQALTTILSFGFKFKEISDVNIPVLINLLESPGIVIRGKTLLCFMFLLKNSTGVLIDLSKSKFFAILDKLLKDNYKYVQFCLHHFLDTLSEKIMQILKSALEGNFSLFSVLPTIFNSVSGRMKLPFPAFIKCISGLLIKDIFETNQIILEILESLTKSKQLKSYSELVITHLFPNLLETLNRNVDTRFRCLKIFFDIAIPFMFDDEIYDPLNISKFSTKIMNEVLVKRLIPLCNDLIEDTEPIPLYCIKLLCYIIERCPEYIAVVKSHGLVLQLLSHFKAGDQKLSMHLMQIIKKFIDSGEVTIDELIEYSLIENFNSVFKYVISSDWCIELTLDILYDLLFALSSRYRDKPNHETFILVENLVICTDLLQSEEDNISEKSAHCLLFILQLFGQYLTLNCSLEQGKALLQILNYNKSGLQKVCIKVVKGVVENLNVPGIMEKIVVLRRHENEEIARIAVEIQTILKSKPKYK